jgi:HNH endonuclease
VAHPKLDAVRQRYQYRCGYCGVSETDTGGELTVDHYRPVTAGGDDSDDNLIYCCPRWLNQVELWFSVLSRRFLKRGDFSSPAEFEERLLRYLERYNAAYAHPYRWTYTGQPLVRGTPFAQTRRQEQRGRAWVGPQRQSWERLLYPPRPYKRSKTPLAANL